MSIRHPLASLFVLAGLGLVVPMLGCDKKKDDASADDDDKGKKKKKKSGDDDDKSGDDDKGSKKKKKKGDDDKSDDDDKGSKKKSSGGGALAVEFEGQKIDLKYGKIRSMGSYLAVQLSTEDIKCDAYKGTDEAYTMSFNIAPGVDGKFWAGEKQGVSVHWASERLKMKREYAYASEAMAVIDPFKLAAKEEVTGTIDFDVSWHDFGDSSKKKKYSASGKWKATICSDYSDYKGIAALPDPGDDALTGSWKDKEGKKEEFTPKVGLAIVRKDMYSKEQSISEVMFFEQDKVSCSETFTVRNKTKILSIGTGFGISGTGDKHQLTTIQPSGGSLTIPQAGKESPTYHSFGEGRVAVKFSELKYEGGDKITVWVTAKSSPGYTYDGSGEIKGKMEVKVCNSW